MIPIFRPKLKKKKGNWGIDKISIVNEPAIMIDGIKFSKEKTEEKFAFIEEEMMMVGPILLPGQKIYRKDKEGKEFYIEFDKETIKECAHRFLRYEKTNDVNLEHEKDTNKAYFVESWIVADPEKDKYKNFNFSIEIPEGAWMGIQKFDSPTLWEEAKQGKYNGFSVEFSSDNFDYEEAGETEVREYAFFSKDETEVKEEFVKPNANESEEEFIGRCVKVVMDEGKDQEQAIAICYTYWDEDQLSKDVKEDNLDSLMKVFDREIEKEIENLKNII